MADEVKTEEETAAEAPAAEATPDAAPEAAADATPEAPQEAEQASGDAGDEAETTIGDLSELGEAVGAETVTEPAAPAEPQIDEHGRAYATGKRKNAVARVWIKPGSGIVTVNGREIERYFARPVLRMVIDQPFQAVARDKQYDVNCTVTGGGLSGQAGAVRHGISKALVNFEPSLRPTLKQGGFLTRDSRVVERKKYGKRKARRSFQFSKR